MDTPVTYGIQNYNHMSQKKKILEWIKDPANRWPVGVTAGYLTFVLGTLVLVFFSFSVPVNLEKEDYYESTLTYQDQIDRMSRTMAMENPVRMEVSSHRDHLMVYFPVEHVQNGINGRVHLFRPSDHRLDREFAVEADDTGFQTIPLAGMRNGKWIVKLHWDSGGKEYYLQQNVQL